jgi:predicted RNase H-like HicB family nuclease
VTIEIQGYVVLTGIVEPEGDQFVSYCRELDTASCGDSSDEALANLGDAIQVHIEALIETGELERVFRERNIRIDVEPSGFGDELFIRVPPGKVFTTYPRQVPFAGGVGVRAV